jgi:O-antigen/teichoic acid export membrane protein
MSTANRFILGMFTGAFSVVLKTGLNLITVPLLLANMGAAPYGLFVLLVNMLELAILLDMGFSEGTIKLLGQFKGQDNELAAQQIMGTAKWLYIGLAILAQGVGLLLIPHFTTWLHVPVALHSAAQLGLHIIFLEVSVSLMLAFCRSILNAHSLQAWNNVTDSMYHIVGNALGLSVLILTPWGIPGFLTARLIAALLRLVIMASQVVKVEPKLWHYPWHSPALKQLFSLSVHALLINFSILVSHSMDQFVIARYLPLRFVPQFEVVFRCLAFVSQLGSKLCEGLMPIFARTSHQTDETGKTRFLFLKMSFVNNAVTCLLLMMIGLHFPLMFHGFSSGKLELGLSLPVLYVAMGIFWSGALQLPASYFLYSSGHHRFLTITSVTTALCNLGLSILLVKPLGIVGVALGTLIPNVIQHQMFLIPKVRQVLAIPLNEYAREVHWTVGLPILVASVLVLVLITGWTQWLGPTLPLMTAFALLAGHTVLGGLIALVTWVYITATESDKATVLHMLKNPRQIKSVLKGTAS